MCLVLGGCGIKTERVSAVDDAAKIATKVDPIVTLKTNNLAIQYQIGKEEPKNWTIAPQLSPDTLNVECTMDENTLVTFLTDSQKEHFQFLVKIQCNLIFLSGATQQP